GEAFASGRTDISHNALVNTHLAQQLKIDRHDATVHILQRFALHNPEVAGGKGYWNSYGAAEHASLDPKVRAAFPEGPAPDNVDLVPIRIGPQFMGANQLGAVKN